MDNLPGPQLDQRGNYGREHTRSAFVVRMQKLLPGAAVLTRSDFSQLRHDGIAALVALNPAGGNRRRVFDEGQESERWVIFPQHHLKDCSDGEYRFRLILGGVESDPVTVEIRDGKRSTDTLEFRMPVKKTDLKR